jgi:hypothetical protein
MEYYAEVSASTAAFEKHNLTIFDVSFFPCHIATEIKEKIFLIYFLSLMTG